MKSPIVFRASFQQPIGPMNPCHIKMAGVIEVEIFAKAVNEWRARRPGTRIEFEKISAQTIPSTLQRQMDFHFERQITPWEAFDTVGKLASDEWSTDVQGKVFVTELRRTRLAEKEIHERAEKAKTQ